MRITAEHVSYTYNSKSKFAVQALKDVNLTIEEGEFFGIIGHTGSGKSTFIQHLNGLLLLPSAQKKYKPKKPKKGEILPPTPVLKVGEYDLTDKKTDFLGLRSKVGMVFQYPEYQLFAETVFEDVAFGLKNFSKEPLKAEAVETAVREALEMVGLNYAEVKDKSPFDLSGGQKRRVAIAGVIVTRPEVLVLDEPAAGLDPLGKKELMSLLHRIHRSWCRTVIFVSHDMDEVAENCTGVAVFSEGEVKFVLPPRELFKKHTELKALGLDLPVTARLVRLLEKKGIKIDCDFTRDDFIQKVTQYLQREGV
ncbi:MAG: energy-coupling factor transporter ATPase [Clostridia bacterium]|nr:energy-coupling factor transporter ATPase [Clostridia bacterium]